MISKAIAQYWSVFRYLLLISIMIYILGAIAGVVIGAHTPIEQMKRLDPAGIPRDPMYYITHNGRSILYFAGGLISFGITSVYALFINGVFIGFSLTGLMKYIPLVPTLLHVIPHGVFEVPSMVIAGAVGLYPIQLLIQYARAKEKVRIHWLLIAQSTALFILLLCIAGIIEAWVTPLVVKAVG
jgi:uncharacterized membrane protein SpoIIM required for sporulation